ncbi:hypothetical protein PIB30_069682 [Stylosanthes scabra]|uniref:Uncharacterized protein n=1 Tax=Stylosanthes scabra TaxID=79078 RepID=A0ABU6VP74_9FABA|nr:hypothetical protein [Stylosanthes scabra]
MGDSIEEKLEEHSILWCDLNKAIMVSTLKAKPQKLIEGKALQDSVLNATSPMSTHPKDNASVSSEALRYVPPPLRQATKRGRNSPWMQDKKGKKKNVKTNGVTENVSFMEWNHSTNLSVLKEQPLEFHHDHSHNKGVDAYLPSPSPLRRSSPPLQASSSSHKTPPTINHLAAPFITINSGEPNPSHRILSLSFTLFAAHHTFGHQHHPYPPPHFFFLSLSHHHRTTVLLITSNQRRHHHDRTARPHTHAYLRRASLNSHSLTEATVAVHLAVHHRRTTTTPNHQHQEPSTLETTFGHPPRHHPPSSHQHQKPPPRRPRVATNIIFLSTFRNHSHRATHVLSHSLPKATESHHRAATFLSPFFSHSISLCLESAIRLVSPASAISIDGAVEHRTQTAPLLYLTASIHNRRWVTDFVLSLFLCTLFRLFPGSTSPF